MQLHQADEEAGGPILIDAQRLLLFYKGEKPGRSVLSVVEDLQGQPCLRPAEQRIDEEAVGSIDPQQQRQHPLAGLDAHPRQIKNGGGVGDDHLLQSLCLEVFEYPRNAGGIEFLHGFVFLSVIFVSLFLFC